MDKHSVASLIRTAFAQTPYPGDHFLVGSREGCEPEDEAGSFRGRTDWRGIEPSFLDGHYAALSFFSEGAFRFYLPAFMLANLDGTLLTADPVGALTGGFFEVSIRVEAGGRTFTRRSGGKCLLNPRRYGGMTFGDYSRMRLSVFTREEAGAIVAYLEYRRETDDVGSSRGGIDAALDSFWRERTRSAPSAAALDEHLAEDQELFRALTSRGTTPA